MYTESTGRGNERGESGNQSGKHSEDAGKLSTHYSLFTEIGNEDVPRHQQYWIDLIVVIINMPGLRILFNHVTLPQNTNCHQHINTFYYYPTSLPHVHWVSAVQCTSTGQLRFQVMFSSRWPPITKQPINGDPPLTVWQSLQYTYLLNVIENNNIKNPPSHKKRTLEPSS